MITSYCRLCMSEEELQSIDSFLLQAIRNEFEVEIRTNDELSQEICKNCSQFILKMIDFKKNVINVQKVLQKMLKRNSDCAVSSDPLSNNSDKVSTDVTIEIGGNPIDRQLKDNTEGSPENQENINFIRKIIRSIDFNEIPSLNVSPKLTWHPNGTYCEVCGVSLKQQFAFVKHMKSTSHVFKSYIAKKYGKLDIVRQYICGYTCRFCREVKTSKKELARHSREAHGFTAQRLNLKPDTLVFKNGSLSGDLKSRKICPVSRKVVPKERLLKEVDDNIKTEPLDASADNTNDKVPGEIIEVDPRKYPCKFCTRSFCFVESFHRHLKKHHPEKYVCAQCGFVSSNRKLYAQHIRSHYNLTANQRVCSVCFKICNDNVELHAHRKRVHDPIKRTFVCSLCKGTFATIIELKDHKRKEHFASQKDAAKSNLRCKKCNRTFLSQLVLKIHQCTAKKFVCLKKCGKRFESFTKMERHMKRCTKGHTIYTCMYCRKKLSCLKTLKHHLSKCSMNLENTNDAQTVPSRSKIPLQEASITCTLCELRFHAETAFEKHYDKYHKSIPGSSKPEDGKSRNVIGRVTADQMPIKDAGLFVREKFQNDQIDLTNIDNKSTEDPAARITDGFIAKKNFWRCKKCRQKCLSIIELEQHFSSCSGIKTEHVKCHCGAIFVDEKVLRLHNIVDHQGDKSVITKKSAAKSSLKAKKKTTDVSANATANANPDIAKSALEISVKTISSDTDATRKSLPNERSKGTTREDATSKYRKNSLYSDKNEGIAVLNPPNAKDNSKIPVRKVDSKPKRSSTCIEKTAPDNTDLGTVFATGDKNNESSVKNISNTKSDANASEKKPDSRQQSTSYDERNKNSSFPDPVSSQTRVAGDMQRVAPNSSIGDRAITDKNLESAKVFASTCKSKPTNRMTETVACFHCGLVFNSKYFLHKHEFDAHEIVRDPAAGTDMESKRSTSNNYFRKEKPPTCEPIDKNTVKFYNKPNYHVNRHHSAPKIGRNNRSLSESERFDDTSRWRKNQTFSRKKEEPQRHRSGVSLLKPDYLLSNGQITVTNSPSNCNIAGRNQLTITSNVNNAVCEICRNPEPHLFCTACRTCYRGNQVQYMNHMKMKHSS